MNTVNLIGRLTDDLMLQKTQSGKDVTKGTLAVDGFNEKTNFIRIVAWNKVAEVITRYCSKGSQIGVTGHIETGSYDDKDGKKVYTTEVIVDNVHLLGSKNDNTQPKQYKEPQYEVEPEPVLSIDSDDLPF